jgi:spore maturation protein CgeB
MRILYVTPNVRNAWNGTLHTPLQKELAKRGVKISKFMLSPNEINKNFDIFFADVEPHAKGWTNLKIKKVMFMEDVWPPTSTRMKGRHSARIYKHADAVMIRYKGAWEEKMTRLKIHWKQPIFWLPHCIDPKIFKDWKQKKNIDALSVGTLMHKSTKEMRTFFLNTIKKMNIKHKRAQADRYKREFKGANFSKIINRARVTGTTNTQGQALAKCFEIPASRSCMFCNDSDDMENLGFIDGETYVRWSKENLRDKLHYYLIEEPEMLQQITENGYNMVHERHSTKVRADEWMSYMQQIMEM